MKGTQRGMDRRIVAQLFDSIDSVTSMDMIAKESNDDDPIDKEGHVNTMKIVVLIAATNRFIY